MNIQEAIQIEIKKHLKLEIAELITETLKRMCNVVEEIKEADRVLGLPNPGIKQLLSEREASVRYGLSKAWFSQARHRGTGPKFIKMKGKVLYPINETDLWFRNFTKTNTVDEPKILKNS